VAPPAEHYEIVPYSDRLRDDVLQLRSTFRGISDAWNAAHFHWQQEECPWFDGHQAALAIHHGRVVAMRLLQPAEWEVGTPVVRLRAPCYAGTVIKEGHRTRGLMTLLTRSVEGQARGSGARFALNLNAGPVTHVSAMAEGWRSLGAFGAMLRPGALEGSSLARRGARVLWRAASRLRPALRRGVKLSRRVRAEAMAELAAQSRQAGRIRHVKDERWFRWRYADPSSRYLFAYFESAQRLVGYMAFHRVAPPLPAGPMNLVDWEVGEGLEWPDMLDVAMRLADRRVVALGLWAALLPAESRARLPSLGFTPRTLSGPLARRRPTFLVGRIRGFEQDAAPDSPGAEAAAWTVNGLRIDRAEDWDARPVFADPF
jgi:GNAT superfamily N-acetyltransferase